MLLYLIRHGDPDYVHDSLTPLGQRQAEALARRLAVHGLDRIYASPLGRAIATAKPTSEILNLPIEIEEWCSEALAWQDFAGKMENGQSMWAFHQQNTTVKTEESMQYTNDNWYELDCFRMINGKEGYARIQNASDDFLSRQGYVREGAKYRIERPNDDRVAVFCHQGFGMAWLSVLLQIPPQYTFASFDFTHASISIFHFANNPDGYSMPRCLTLSDTSFLYEDRLPLKYNNTIDI
ncbi:MAG: histidine phosphatase family protein [Clostridia bacterium]|nr:histidine phosphatase family protein [Clostridia bacterium]